MAKRAPASSIVAYSAVLETSQATIVVKPLQARRVSCACRPPYTWSQLRHRQLIPEFVLC